MLSMNFRALVFLETEPVFVRVFRASRTSRVSGSMVILFVNDVGPSQPVRSARTSVPQLHTPLV